MSKPIKPNFALGAASVEKLKGVHPLLVRVVKRAIEISAHDFSVGEGVRSPDTQRRYVATGKSQTMNSKHLLQNDGFGHAVDLWAYDKGVHWDEARYYPIMRAMCQAAHELKVDVRTGACWVNLRDLEPTDAAMRQAVQQYVAARKALKRKPFLDFVHFEL